tara:strand:+ start:276 stop:1109 length:834 start_codon:yes stop_codon:yes gene_type:complete
MKISLRQRIYILKRKLLDVKYSKYESDSGNEEGFANYEDIYSKAEINFSDFRSNPIFQFVTHNGQLDFAALTTAYEQDELLLSKYLDMPKSDLGYSKNLKYKFLDRLDSRHIMMSTIIASFKRDFNTIVEIGGGFGNWYRLNRTIMKFKEWYIIDLPFVLDLQKWYLKNENNKIDMLSFISAYETNYIKSNLGNKQNIDLVIGAHSLSEMSMKDFNFYFNNIVKKSSYFFYAGHFFNFGYGLAKKKLKLISKNFSLIKSVESEKGSAINNLYINKKM